VLGGIQDQHLLLILLLKEVKILLGGRRVILQQRLWGFVPSALMMVLVIELGLQEGLFVLVA
jgi:hypothetical protein